MKKETKITEVKVTLTDTDGNESIEVTELHGLDKPAREPKKNPDLSDKANELWNSLEAIAEKKSTPFCYQCYRGTETGVCPNCHSDDLMREVKGVGVEYGLDWVVKEILETEIGDLNDQEFAAQYDEMLDDCYNEIKLGDLTFLPSDVIKKMDPVAYRTGYNDYLDSITEDDLLVTFDNGVTYYEVCKIEEYIQDNS